MIGKVMAGLALLGFMFGVFAEPIKVAGSTQEKKLVTKVTPQYPQEAKDKGIQGTVKLQAVINKDGAVKETKVLSGPEQLVQSAVEAVNQWVYEPTLLKGAPVEVITDITVNYTLAK